MRGRDFVTLQDFTGEEIQTILDVAFQLKRENAIGQAHELLKNKTLGMLFAQPSTRTRVSFETGMTQLGGHAQYYSEDSMQRKNKETWADTGLVLSRYLNALMVRLYDLEEYGMARDIMNEIRKNTTIPVINGLDDKEHPCQCMGDLMVIQEKLGAGWKKKKIVMSWAYSDRVKSPGVPQAMLTACSLLGADITLAYPKGYELDDQYMEFAQNAAKSSGSVISVTNDIYEACTGADVISASSSPRIGASPTSTSSLQILFPTTCIRCPQHATRKSPTKSSTDRTPSFTIRPRTVCTLRRQSSLCS